MENAYPKRYFQYGKEPQVKKINNSCRMNILNKLAKALPTEYNDVKSDPVFAQVFAIHENGLRYSARLIHIIMCRQLKTAKVHELWFVFGGKPLRFSLQEFHAVTGFNCIDKGSHDSESWKDDGGFWSKILKSKKNISIKQLTTDDHLIEVRKWELVDRKRLVYVCVIAGLIMAKSETKHIPHSYIKMIMDLYKVRQYPWGLRAFEHLCDSIIKTREDLKNKSNSYVLDGFSNAFQIWVMEAIPLIGKLLGQKINNELTEGPRCSNWKGAAKILYEDIIILENTFQTKDDVYPYISITGSFDVCESASYVWSDEFKDSQVDKLNFMIISHNDFSSYMWECVEDDELEVENEVVLEGDNDVSTHGNDEIGQGCGLKRSRDKKSDIV